MVPSFLVSVVGTNQQSGQQFVPFGYPQQPNGGGGIVPPNGGGGFIQPNGGGGFIQPIQPGGGQFIMIGQPQPLIGQPQPLIVNPYQPGIPNPIYVQPTPPPPYYPPPPTQAPPPPYYPPPPPPPTMPPPTVGPVPPTQPPRPTSNQPYRPVNPNPNYPTYPPSSVAETEISPPVGNLFSFRIYNHLRRVNAFNCKFLCNLTLKISYTFGSFYFPIEMQ